MPTPSSKAKAVSVAIDDYMHKAKLAMAEQGGGRAE